MEKVAKILRRYRAGTREIIQILHDIQNEYNYLPQSALTFVSRELHIPLSRIYSIATFYAAFSLIPRGRHLCTVCLGTACHVRGAAGVLNRLEESLGIKAGSTTADNLFTLETVNCLGACALAPIVVIDGKYHGPITADKVAKLLDKYLRKVKSQRVK